MSRSIPILVFLASICVIAGGPQRAVAQAPDLCSAEWQDSIDRVLVSGDGQGHGPDIGSDEWKSVVEFKLGIRDMDNVPNRDSEAWCRHIDQLVSKDEESGPSFSCDEVKPGSTEALICEDEGLAAFDRKLAEVYAAATKIAVNEHPPVLKTEQRGWIKGRDECWKSEDQRECVREEYVRRIAELQARYRLVSYSGPFFYACDGNAANEVVATFFETEPPTLIAERGDSVSLMYIQPSASGIRYEGRNESFWEHQGEASIVWGYGAPEMKCERSPR